MGLFASSGNWMVALGKTLIHSIWIALLILALLRLILHSIPDHRSSLRYRISVFFMIFLLGSVCTLFILIFAPESSLQLASDKSGSASLLSIPLWVSSLLQDTENPHLIYVLSAYLYFAGIPLVLFRSLASVRTLQMMKKSGNPVPEAWQRKFVHLKNSLGIRKHVAFLETNRLNSPALIGIIKPVILVPAGMFSNLSVSQVETILMHELYHLRRFDFFVNVIQLFIENIFFYHPAVWTISNIIRNEREKCCDDRVLNTCGDPLGYAKALYQLAGQENQCSHLVPGAGGTNQFQLFARIKRILKQNAMKSTIREKLFSILIFAVGVLVMLTVTGFSSGFSIMKDNESRQKETVAQQTFFSTIQKQEAVSDTIPKAGKEVEKEPAKAIAIEEIDWEEIKKEMEEARIEVMEEIDWEEIKKEMKEARIKAMEEIDWEEIKREMKEARMHLDSLKMDMDFDFDFDMDIDIDMDELREEVSISLEGIDWEELEQNMTRLKVHMDSVFTDMDFDFDVDL